MRQEQLLSAESGDRLRYSCLYRLSDRRWAFLSRCSMFRSLVVSELGSTDLMPEQVRAAHLQAFSTECFGLGLPPPTDISDRYFWPNLFEEERELRERLSAPQPPALQQFLSAGLKAAVWGLATQFHHPVFPGVAGEQWALRTRCLGQVLQDEFCSRTGLSEDHVKAWAILLETLGAKYPDAELDLLQELQLVASQDLTTRIEVAQRLVLELPVSEQVTLQSAIDGGLDRMSRWQGADTIPQRYSLCTVVGQMLAEPAHELFECLSSAATRARLAELAAS